MGILGSVSAGSGSVTVGRVCLHTLRAGSRDIRGGSVTSGAAESETHRIRFRISATFMSCKQAHVSAPVVCHGVSRRSFFLGISLVLMGFYRNITPERKKTQKIDKFSKKSAFFWHFLVFFP